MDTRLVHYIIGHFDERTNIFRFGRKYVMYSPKDFTLILGLPLNDIEGRAINTKECRSSTTRGRHLFKRTGRLFKKVIFEKVKDLLEDKNSDNVEGVVKLLILYLFASILFSQTNNSINIGMRYYIDNLD